MLKQLSIRVQMVVIIVLTSVITLLTSFSFLIIYDLTSLRQSIVTDMKVQAKIIADNTSAAVSFADAAAARDVLATLKSKPEVEAAVVYLQNKKPLAAFSRAGGSTADIARIFESEPDPKLLLTTNDLVEGGEANGQVKILSNFNAWEQRKGTYILASIAMAFIALLTSFVIGSYMQKLISTPLVKVSRVMSKVTETRDYSQRLPVESANEVGVLVSGLNQMLAEIEESTARLKDEVKERLSKEEELRVSQKQLADFFQAAPLGLVRIDPAGAILQANKAEADMLGCSEDELLGRSLEEFVEDKLAFGKAMAQLTSEQSLSSIEAKFICKDGTVKVVEINANSLFEEGQMVQTRLFTKDVTLIKQAELDHEEKVLAVRANQAKTEFLSRMSHELRTPLNAILGFGQLLEMGSLDDRQQECVDHILKGGRHLLNLINEVLNISKIEAGDITISLEPVYLAEVVGEVLDLVKPLAVPRGISLENAVAPHRDICVKGDRQRLSQVLINLVSNAVKYNKDHGHVLISAEPLEDTVKIRVADTGPGISDKHVNRLFIPFDRLGAEQTNVEGSGLGLAYSKALIEAMNGRLYLDRSFSGPGACFVVEIGSAMNQVLIPGQEVEPKRLQLSAAPSGKKTVLIVEDNEANILLYRHIFDARTKADLLIAAQGALGVQYAENHLPDLVLLDANLPDMHGSEVAARLRANPKFKNLPIIVVSADATEHTQEQFRQHGILAYLTKPVNVRTLLELVDSTLSQECEQGA